MESVLLVSCSEKGNAFFLDMVSQASIEKVVTIATCAKARQILLERDFDLCIINSPLSDESGVSLAKHISTTGITQVILVVKGEQFDEVSEAVEDYGVLTVLNPVNRNLFWSAIKFAKSTQNKYRVMQDEMSRLTQKIEDIRIIDRAKCILISQADITEGEAHRFIEKNAMDRRITKREIAEEILRKYENGGP